MQLAKVTFLVPSLLLPCGLAGAEAPEGMVLVPAGEFVMGSDTGGFDEAPAHRVRLPAFYIDRYEVTNAQFARFVRESESYDRVEGPWFRDCAEGCVDLIAHFEQRYDTTLDKFSPPGETATEEPMPDRMRDAACWHAAFAALRQMVSRDAVETGDTESLVASPAVRRMVESQADYPVRNVTWRDAQAYAGWSGKRLPTEAEWEKAARGSDGRTYPWGDDWSGDRCRTGRMPRQAAVFAPVLSSPTDAGRATTTETGPARVGSYPDGASPYGCQDMAGNVWEWTADWYGEDYYGASEGAFAPTGPVGRPDGQLPRPYSDSALLRTPEQGRSTNTRKVIRGGGWSGPPNQSPFNARATRRFWSNPNYWHPDVGFRCVKDGP